MWTQESKPPILQTGESHAITVRLASCQGESTKDKGKSINPTVYIFPITENVRRRISLVPGSARGESNECGEDDGKVGDDKDVLHSGKNFGDRAAKKTLEDVDAEEDAINLTGGSSPVAILRN
jgi:hypothetical protein